MRYAIFSDIHGNLPAWNAVLADMRALETDVYVCLGDIVGYGPRPQEVLDGIRATTSNFVIGNHDAAAVGILDASIFNDQAREVIEWTRNQLNEESITFLREMPLVIEDEEIMFVHAEVEEPGRFLYIDSEEEALENFQAGTHRLTFVGHTHNPGIFVENPDRSIGRLPDEDGILQDDSRYIINVGSVGEPRNPDDIRARYVIFDEDTNTVAFRRIEFDVEAYRGELTRSGLNVTPYFLRVVDHYQEALAQSQAAGAGHAMMVDMQSASITPLSRTTETRQLVVPPPSGRTNRPKPKVTPPSQKKAPITIALSITALLVVAVGAAMWFTQEEPVPEELIVEGEDRVLIAGEELPASEDSSSAGNSLASMVAAESGGTAPDLERREFAPLPSEGPIGHWHFDKPDDAMETPAMELISAGKASPPLIDPVPWTGAKNPGAVIAGGWEEATANDWFSLRPDRSFTFECWFSSGTPSKDIEFIAGNRSDLAEGFRGWHLVCSVANPTALMFEFDPGNEDSVKLEVLDEAFFDGTSHHLALVWNHQGDPEDEGEGKGLVDLLIDGKKRGSVEIPHNLIPDEPGGKKFCLGDRLTVEDNRFRGTLDEARFSSGVLLAWEFLSAVGEATEADPPSGSKTMASAPKPGLPPEPNPDPEKPMAEPSPPPKPKTAPVEPPYSMEAVSSLGKGLIFYAPLDALAGSKMAWDFSGKGRHLPIGGAIPGEEGKIETAFRLERKQLTSTAKPLPQLEKATVSFWIKTVGQQAPNQAGNLVSIQNAFNTTLQRSIIQARMGQGGPGVRVALPPKPEWQHVIIENNGVNSIITIDGSQRKAAKEAIKQTGDIKPGVMIGSGNAAKFSIDEVAIWDRSLSPAEKKDLYLRGKHGSPILSPAKVIAHWKLDEPRNARIFEDSQGDNRLGIFSGNWAPYTPIAPNPVPLTGAKNPSSATVGLIGEDPKNAGAFALKKNAGFTFEGWFRGGNEKVATLGSTMGENGEAGWGLAVVRERGRTGSVHLRYGKDENQVEAHRDKLVIFDSRPHHFAAVWDPNSAPDSGTLSVYIDNELVDSKPLPLANIAEGKSGPLQIGSPGVELTVDEIRFSATALKPGTFLTAGRAAVEPKPLGEEPEEKKPEPDKDKGKAKGK